MNESEELSPSRRSRRFTAAFGTTVVLVLAAMTVVTTRWWGCTFPPRGQAAAVAAYRADPAFSLVPPNGRLIGEAARTRACDNRTPTNREDSTGPEFASVWRQYRVDRMYPVDELGALFGPDVQAAGWHARPSHGDPGIAALPYCKEINGVTAWLDVTSLADGTPDHTPTVIVRIDGHPHAGC